MGGEHSIQPHPELEQLKRDVTSTRERIGEALLTLDDLALVKIPMTKLNYSVCFGSFETELLNTEIAYRRAKRKLQLAQAAVNVGQPVQVEELEKALDDELSGWTKRAEEAVAQYLESLEKLGRLAPMAMDEEKEVRKIYLVIVKRLHPDFSPCHTEFEERMFRLAQQAYERGDLGALKSIEATTTSSESAEFDVEIAAKTSEDTLKIMLSMLTAKLIMINARIGELEDTYPYKLRAQLEDEDWVQETIATLKLKTEHHRELQENYTQKFQELLAR